MRKKSILLTGATGILGSWVLANAIERGYDPVVLARDATSDRARSRLNALLQVAGCRSTVDNASIIRGDVSLPRLGLDAETAKSVLDHVDGVIHCAASTSFDPAKDEEVWRTNVNGTRHVLDFLEGNEVPLFHVSTAYVAGTRNDVALEQELDRGQDFKNTYERSKFTAEGMIRDAIEDRRIHGLIVRPSIIVGAARNGCISQFLNFYTFLKIIKSVADGRVRPGRFLRLQTTDKCTMNLVPVDWVASALWNIVEKEGPNSKTYHLTNPTPISFTIMSSWANGFLTSKGCSTRIVAVDDFAGEITKAERVARHYLRHYHRYMTKEPVYDRTNTDGALNDALPFPRMEEGFLSTLFDYAESQEWKPAEPISASDGDVESGNGLSREELAESCCASMN